MGRQKNRQSVVGARRMVGRFPKDEMSRRRTARAKPPEELARAVVPCVLSPPFGIDTNSLRQGAGGTAALNACRSTEHELTGGSESMMIDALTPWGSFMMQVRV